MTVYVPNLLMSQTRVNSPLSSEVASASVESSRSPTSMMPGPEATSAMPMPRKGVPLASVTRPFLRSSLRTPGWVCSQPMVCWRCTTISGVGATVSMGRGPTVPSTQVSVSVAVSARCVGVLVSAFKVLVAVTWSPYEPVPALAQTNVRYCCTS